MKTLHHLHKELLQQSRSWYFYVELFVALVIFAILLFLVPANFDRSTEEYVYLDMPEQRKTLFYEDSLKEDLDGKSETVTLKVDDTETQALRFKSERKDIYYVESEQIARRIADKEREIAAKISFGEDGKQDYVFYTQGYESERLNNLVLVVHNDKVDVPTIRDDANARKVITIGDSGRQLDDRQYLIPLFLALNCSYLVMFVIAALAFLDKAEGTIKALAVTPSSLWQYALSKMGVLTISNIVSSLIIAVPFFGMQANYALLLMFLIASGFFAMALGLLIATFFDDMMQSFSTLFILILVLMVPAFAYMTPSWNPGFVKWIPTHYMLEGFKETVLQNRDITYVFTATAGFLVAGGLLLFFAVKRFKRTLTA